jgi:hypothetical protein
MNSLNQFKDTNKVIGSCISKKVRQHNGEKTKKDLQNTTQNYNIVDACHPEKNINICIY